MKSMRLKIYIFHKPSLIRKERRKNFQEVTHSKSLISH
jgi:hypothetical protein